jgi:hypothetical protein
MHGPAHDVETPGWTDLAATAKQLRNQSSNSSVCYLGVMERRPLVQWLKMKMKMNVEGCAGRLDARLIPSFLLVWCRTSFDQRSMETVFTPAKT